MCSTLFFFVRAFCFFVVWTTVFFSSSVESFGANCPRGSWIDTRPDGWQHDANSMPPNLRVVIFGDQGADEKHVLPVLDMAKNFGAEMIIHAGDFDYIDTPSIFFKFVDSMGEGFPYFTTIGNHDLIKWDGEDGYKAGLLERLPKIQDAVCWGEIGVNMACSFKGLLFVLSGVGTKGQAHVEFMNEVFTTHPSVWKICNWHKNQRLYQVGGKSDEVSQVFFSRELISFLFKTIF